MARTREIPTDPQLASYKRGDWEGSSGSNSILDARKNVQVAKGRDESSLAALMECAPHQDPAPSQESLYPLREVIQDTIELVLDEREQFIFDAIVVERVSYRTLAVRMSLAKSHLHRIQHESCRKLRDALAPQPIIHDHLNLKGTYN